MTKLLEPVRVELDIALTRRTRTHAVIDAEGVQVHHAKRLSEILMWLHEQDVKKAIFVDDLDSWSVVFHPITEDHTT